MNRFEDKVVLATGAAAGIGEASALRMGREGARVACADLQTEAAEQTAEQIRESGGEAISIACDVSDPLQVKSTVEKTLGAFGKLDSLCNIAGILHFDNTHDLSLEKWHQVLQVNLTGTFMMCQAALPHLLADGGGNIVNMASTAGMAGHPWTAAYSASKGGILALSYTLAVEYGKQGLRCNAVCPGGVQTAMHSVFKLPEGADIKLLDRIIPLSGFSGPEKAASLVAFLASDEASHINGERIRVDGGTLA